MVGKEPRRIYHGYYIPSLQDGEMRGSGPIDSQGRYQLKKDISKHV